MDNIQIDIHEFDSRPKVAPYFDAESLTFCFGFLQEDGSIEAIDLNCEAALRLTELQVLRGNVWLQDLASYALFTLTGIPGYDRHEFLVAADEAILKEGNGSAYGRLSAQFKEEVAARALVDANWDLSGFLLDLFAYSLGNLDPWRSACLALMVWSVLEATDPRIRDEGRPVHDYLATLISEAG